MHIYILLIYSDDDPVLRTMLDMAERAEDTMQCITEGPLLDVFPLSRYLPYGPRHVHNTLQQFSQLQEAASRVFNTELSHIADMVTPYIGGELYKLKSKSPEVTQKSLDNTLIMHVLAGSVTTTSTLYALVNILLRHPHVYRKLQNEIDDVIGSRHVTMSDRDNLPYLMATINETLRYTSVMPLLVPHRSVVDTQLDGKHVPRDTTVFVNAWSLHHDSDLYPEPWRFNPDRFLDPHSRNLVSADHPCRRNLYTFGAGPRACLGESLARSRLFAMTASLVQTWQFTLGSLVTSCDPRSYQPGVVFSNNPYTVTAVPR